MIPTNSPQSADLRFQESSDNAPAKRSEPTSLENRLVYWFQKLLLYIPKLFGCSDITERTLAFHRAWHVLSLNRVDGDYLEFGVFEGTSFDLSLRAAKKVFGPRDHSPRFIAFDSFEGLPEPSSDRDGNVFRKGEYSSSKRRFQRHIRASAKGRDVRIVDGFFEDVLSPKVIEEHDLRKAAFVTIDCDLYEPTYLALKFVTPLLVNGSVVYFDDWFHSGGDLTMGEAGACAAWLRENPHIRLVEYRSVGLMGKMFIVNCHN